MFVPARSGAADRAPDHPQEPGWADTRRILITNSHVVALAASEVAARPGDEKALAMLGLSRQAMESAIEMARREVIDEAILAAREREAYARGAADCKAARCRLEVVGGG